MDERPTKARYLHLTDEIFKKKDGSPFLGDFVKDDVLFRCRGIEGKLDGGDSYAIGDGDHLEYWKNGKLHRENGPAIVSLCEDYKEYWVNGQRVDA